MQILLLMSPESLITACQEGLVNPFLLLTEGLACRLLVGIVLEAFRGPLELFDMQPCAAVIVLGTGGK